MVGKVNNKKSSWADINLLVPPFDIEVRFGKLGEDNKMKVICLGFNQVYPPQKFLTLTRLDETSQRTYGDLPEEPSHWQYLDGKKPESGLY